MTVLILKRLISAKVTLFLPYFLANATSIFSTMKRKRGRTSRAMSKEDSSKKCRGACQEQSSLDAMQSHFTAILDISADGIISIDETQSIQHFNKGAEKIFGYKKEEVIGKPLGILIPEQHRDNHGEHIRGFEKSQDQSRLMGQRSEIFGLHRNGDVLPVEISISKVSRGSQTLFLAVIRDVTERKKREHKMQSSLREKELLLQEVHHRVKNNLQIISSLLSLQADTLGDASEAGVISDAQSRVKSIALIHESLYRSHDFGKIVFTDYIKELSQSLLNSMGVRGLIACKVEDSSETLPLDKAVPCGLMVNELITNSLKHAFRPNTQGTISVRFHSTNDESFVIEVEDDGCGPGDDFDILDSTTLGLQLVSNLAAQLEGNITFKNKKDVLASKGLLVRVIFPKQS